MFEVAQERFGGVDLVCPGAGVFEPPWSNFWHAPGSAQSKDSVDGGRYASLDINMTHPIRVAQIAISVFLSQAPKASPANPKRVVMISSIAGQLGTLPTPIYCAAKYAIIGFTRSLANLDEKLGIRVNCVAPGIIKTPLWTDNPEKMKIVDDTQDLWATPEEVAEAMLALSEDEDMIGGTVLEVGRKQTRRVPLFNNPGPSGAGHTASGMPLAVEEVFGTLEKEGWGSWS
jgi:3-hydroxybutyrate dehydrogenase